MTVLLAPESVMVEVPFVKVLPVPLVSQLPDTVQLPLVSVMVPLTPPVIVTSVTVTEDELASKSPPFGTTRLAPPVIPKPDVVSVPETVSV